MSKILTLFSIPFSVLLFTWHFVAHHKFSTTNFYSFRYGKYSKNTCHKYILCTLESLFLFYIVQHSVCFTSNIIRLEHNAHTHVPDEDGKAFWKSIKCKVVGKMCQFLLQIFLPHSHIWMWILIERAKKEWKMKCV